MSSRRKKASSSFDNQKENSYSYQDQDELIEEDQSQEEEYISYLKSATDFVLPEDSPQFFTDVLAHFNNDDMSENVGLEIFHVLRIFIHIPDYFTEFINGDFLAQLPFDTENNNYVNQILCVIYDVLSVDPTKFPSKLGEEENFRKIVRKEPLKSLSIINLITEKTFNPWIYTDSLYHEVKSYLTDDADLFKSYSSVLMNILEKYPFYRQNRIDIFWYLYSNCLSQTENSDIIRIIYNTLCHLKDYFNPNSKSEENDNINKSKSFDIPAIQDKNIDYEYPPDLPINQILKHIRINSTIRGAIFNLLMSYAEIDDSQHIIDDELIQNLIHYSTKTLKASLILMTIGKNFDGANLIVNHCSRWLDKGLTEPIDTLRLFMIVFQHQELREKLINSRKFVSFLTFITKSLETAATIPIIELILQKGEINDQVMTRLKNHDFFSVFLDAASSNDVETKVSSHAALKFILTATEFGFYTDFLPYLEWISGLKNVDELKEKVAEVAVSLAKNETCAKKMISMDFVDFYEKISSDDSQNNELVLNAKRFLKNV